MRSQLLKQIDIFSAPRQPGDICLVQCITQELISQGMPKPYEWHQNRQIDQALRSNPIFQMHLISDYWRLWLGAHPDETEAARYCLSAVNSTPQEYLDVFIKGVVPVIVKLAKQDELS